MSTPTVSPVGRISRALAAVCQQAEHLAVIMLILTTGLVVMQVAARNFWQQGLAWADELARYGGLGIVFLAIPLLLLRKQHIAVDMISSRLNAPGKRVLLAMNQLIVLVFCGFFMVGGYAFLQRAGKFTTPALSMPNLLFYLPAMVGMLLFSVVAIQQMLQIMVPSEQTGSTTGDQP